MVERDEGSEPQLAKMTKGGHQILKEVAQRASSAAILKGRDDVGLLEELTQQRLPLGIVNVLGQDQQRDKLLVLLQSVEPIRNPRDAFKFHLPKSERSQLEELLCIQKAGCDALLGYDDERCLPFRPHAQLLATLSPLCQVSEEIGKAGIEWAQPVAEVVHASAFAASSVTVVEPLLAAERRCCSTARVGSCGW